MEKMSIATTAINITHFIFAFIQRTLSVYYDWLVDHVRDFLKDWCDFSAKPECTATSDFEPDTSECLDIEPKPKYVSIPLSGTPAAKILKKEGITVWRAKDVQELARTSNRSSIAEKTQHELWLKIREIAQYKQEEKPVVEPVAEDTEAMEEGEKCVLAKNKNQNFNQKKILDFKRKKSHSREFITGTTVKLEEYNKRNRDYLLSKYIGGPAVDNFVFMHPNTKSSFSRNSFILLNPQPRSSKKRPYHPFKPTELSTIFENLAY